MESVLSEEERPLLLTHLQAPRTYLLRWMILFIFSFSSFNQSLFWITFSPISDLTETYFQISTAQVEFILNLGPIVFIPSIIPMLWFSKKGLRWSVLTSLSVQLACCVLRCIPCFFPSELVRSHGANNDYGVAIIYIGHALNAFAGPFVMASPSQVSQTWFGDGERTMATAIGSLANGFGSAAGFILSPLLVPSGQPDQIPLLLYIHTILALIPFILAIFFFPNRPDHPPSLSAQRTLENEKFTSETTSPITFLIELKNGLINKELMLLCGAGGFFSGVFNGWTGIISDIVDPVGYTDTDAGWFGFSSTIGSIIGGLIAGYLGDKYFQRNFKSLLIWILCLSNIFFIWFTLSLPSALWSDSILPQNKSLLMVSITGAGFFLGCTSPLFLEYAVELTYPLPETTSAVFLTFSITSGGLIFLCIPPSETPLMNIFMVGAVFITTIVVSLVPEKYQRANVQK
eukprot:c21649_g3_i3.p1 GENE.c21649_g3_i3~~c21649_g3_i3.p1  ORF type:complete len:459 (+),score=175.57 c21649_g3_i3:32-1408(+)